MKVKSESEKVKLLSRVQLLATSWTAVYQAPPSMGFSRQEYWSRLPLLSEVIANAGVSSTHVFLITHVTAFLPFEHWTALHLGVIETVQS